MHVQGCVPAISLPVVYDTPNSCKPRMTWIEIAQMPATRQAMREKNAQPLAIAASGQSPLRQR